jgi:hypothetical protein
MPALWHGPERWASPPEGATRMRHWGSNREWAGAVCTHVVGRRLRRPGGHMPVEPHAWTSLVRWGAGVNVQPPSLPFQAPALY